MTESEKATAYDHIGEIVAAANQTVDFFKRQTDMGSHVETVQAHAFRQITRRFFLDS